MGFDIQIFDTEQAVANQLAQEIVHIVKQKPNAVLCLACGETPRPVMSKLAKIKAQGGADFSHVRFLGLDEWGGVGRETKGSCAQMLYDDFFIPMNFREDQIHIFNGLSQDFDQEINLANRMVDELGIDFCLLGIGMNGHIGLNEPGFNPNRQASLVNLSKTTKTVMTKYFGEKIQLTQGITLGLQQLLQAKKLVLMATGSRKAAIVKQTIDTKPTNQLPATLLKQSLHSTTFYLDKKAAEKL